MSLWTSTTGPFDGQALVAYFELAMMELLLHSALSARFIQLSFEQLVVQLSFEQSVVQLSFEQLIQRI